ncbi:MAG: HEAT repeat domain-containing protein, partial [Desulfobacterales bacterium]
MRHRRGTLLRRRAPAVWVFAFVMALMQAVTVGAAGARADESAPALLPADDRKPSYHLSLDAAYEAARQDQCPVLMIFRAQWDVFSREFTERTLDSDMFQSFGPCVHLALLDVDRDSELTADYRVTFLPYLVLLTPDGKILAERKGILTPAELTQWIADGVERSNRGEWIGISASGELGKFLEKFRTGTDSAADRQDLIAFLGERHPGDRNLAADIITANPRKFMDQLMTAVNDAHLGTRLGACELIGRIFPEAPLPDSWASKTQRDEGADRLHRWWDDRRRAPDLWLRETGTQRAGRAPSAEKGPAPAAVRKLIQEIQSADAVRRTRAMTELAGMGPAVLPALQHAIDEAEALGKEDIVLLLDDTRWSIVVTAEIARALPPARRVLSRGTSKDRRELAGTLAKLGRPAVAVLAEMTREDDVLVQESALRALAKINSREATAAIADVLSSQNANLRMVTAQLLGKTGRPEAARFLKQVLQDPNDVVAATAISALEELDADSEGTALIACLSDSRWRIRAVAAEVIGKLEIGSAGRDLVGLLDDPDPFVVRAALRALDKLKIHATPEQIRKAASKHPDLLGGIIAYILNSRSSELPQTIGALYENADAAGKKQILTMLGQKEIEKKNLDLFWTGFFGGVMAVDDPRTRSLALLAMQSLWVELTQPYIENGLVDSDPQVRLAAVKALLKLACYHYGTSSSGKGPDYGILRYHQKTPEEIKAEFEKQHEDPPDNLEEKIKRAGRIAELHRTWHRLIKSSLGEPAQMREIMALGITGDAGQALAMLPAALTPEFIRRLTKRSYLNCALEQMLAQLKWPENRTLINELMQDPTTYIILLAHADKAGSDLVSCMLSSPDLIRALCGGSKPLRRLIVKKLISNDSAVSLMQPANNIAG